MCVLYFQPLQCESLHSIFSNWLAERVIGQSLVGLSLISGVNGLLIVFTVMMFHCFHLQAPTETLECGSIA